MAHRPYPNVDRALRHLARHYRPRHHLAAVRPPRRPYPVDEYRLSTRPGIVGGSS
ncbi:hypothetical protein ACJ6WF_16815 [Streptomyces sp. MMS24-I2-30]|uniref:hypothetical protein n=1 Tax=Streptomyces sp. MMS24-I2-30 TaxID=3351564 RepID=UPI003896CD76